MKVIFLDIDGVLNTTADWIEWETFSREGCDSVRQMENYVWKNRFDITNLIVPKNIPPEYQDD
jgi:hypothetical protein